MRGVLLFPITIYVQAGVEMMKTGDFCWPVFGFALDNKCAASFRKVPSRLYLDILSAFDTSVCLISEKKTTSDRTL